MDTNHPQKPIDKVADKNSSTSEEAIAAAKQSSRSASPAPSASTSPSHEFSFTISLHSSSTTSSNIPDKTKSRPPNSFAIDLTPADDIFFHGHLLPLHLLSHLPVSPRSSTNSLDSFTLPIKDLPDHPEPTKSSTSNTTTSNNGDTKGARSKSKSFSIFGFTRRQKGCENGEREDEEKHKRKFRFDVSRLFQRYARMVRPLIFFRGRRPEDNIQLRRQPYSFSGNLTSLRKKQDLRRRRGEFSAPASMRTSPTNSGLLLPTATLPTSTSNSTMEELQAAIQAAIAHCKKSTAVEEKLK